MNTKPLDHLAANDGQVATRASQDAPPLVIEMVEPPQETCAWSEHDPFGVMPGTYATACGELWAFTEGGVKENGVKFCHNCGKPVEVIPFPQPADSESEAA